MTGWMEGNKHKYTVTNSYFVDVECRYRDYACTWNALPCISFDSLKFPLNLKCSEEDKPMGWGIFFAYMGCHLVKVTTVTSGLGLHRQLIFKVIFADLVASSCSFNALCTYKLIKDMDDMDFHTLHITTHPSPSDSTRLCSSIFFHHRSWFSAWGGVATVSFLYYFYKALHSIRRSA